MVSNAAASILMPVGGVRGYVAAAVDSVLRQTAVDLELLVIDDGGGRGDPIAELQAVSDPRLRVLKCQGRGIAAALNTGINAATGRYWFRCDADDLYPPDRITKQIAFLEAHPEFGAVTGGMSAISPEGEFVADMNVRSGTEEITDELRSGVCRSSLCSWAVRMDLIRATGGFRTYFNTAEDIDMQFRLADRCRVWYEADLTYYYRVHDASTTQSHAAANLDFYDRMAREFQVQRKAGGADALDVGDPPEPPPFRAGDSHRPRVQDLLIGSAWERHRNGRKAEALAIGLRALRSGPHHPSVWRTLAALVVKPAGPKRPPAGDRK